MLQGEPPRSTHESLLQREIVEYVLVSEGGYSRRDLYGVERDAVGSTRRYDLAAILRRFLNGVGRFRAVSVASGAWATLGVVAALSGLRIAPVILAVGVVVAAGLASLPDRAFERPGPRTYHERHIENGMTDDEAMRRFAIYNESEELRAEKIQKERRKERRKARSRGHNR